MQQLAHTTTTSNTPLPTNNGNAASRAAATNTTAPLELAALYAKYDLARGSRYNTIRQAIETGDARLLAQTYNPMPEGNNADALRTQKARQQSLHLIAVLACIEGKSQLLDFILQHVPTLHQPDTHHTFPLCLYLALKTGNTSIQQQLTQGSAANNITQDSINHTFLVACAQGERRVMQHLLETGINGITANVNAVCARHIMGWQILRPQLTINFVGKGDDAVKATLKQADKTTDDYTAQLQWLEQRGFTRTLFDETDLRGNCLQLALQASMNDCNPRTGMARLAALSQLLEQRGINGDMLSQLINAPNRWMVRSAAQTFKSEEVENTSIIDVTIETFMAECATQLCAEHRDTLPNTQHARAKQNQAFLIARFEWLFANGLDLNQQMKLNRHHFLSWPCQYGYHDLIEYFIKQKGLDVNSQDRHGCTPLHYAIDASTVSFISSVAPNVNLDLANHEGATPMRMRYTSDQRGAFEQLLCLGADPNCMAPHQPPVLHTAAARNQLDDIALLLSAGADPKLRYTQPAPPAHAAQGGPRAGAYTALEYAKVMHAYQSRGQWHAQKPDFATIKRLLNNASKLAAGASISAEAAGASASTAAAAAVTTTTTTSTAAPAPTTTSTYASIPSFQQSQRGQFSGENAGNATVHEVPDIPSWRARLWNGVKTAVPNKPSTATLTTTAAVVSTAAVAPAAAGSAPAASSARTTGSKRRPISERSSLLAHAGSAAADDIPLNCLQGGSAGSANGPR